MLIAVGLFTIAAPVRSEEPKHGGILRLYYHDSPGSPSILEESSNSVTAPFLVMLKNLLYGRTNRATRLKRSGQSWHQAGHRMPTETTLIFQLRKGVTRHDGRRFTAKDVKCTWDLLQAKGDAKLRINPRDGWYHNSGIIIKDVVLNGDYGDGQLVPEDRAQGLPAQTQYQSPHDRSFSTMVGNVPAALHQRLNPDGEQRIKRLAL